MILIPCAPWTRCFISFRGASHPNANFSYLWCLSLPTLWPQLYADLPLREALLSSLHHCLSLSLPSFVAASLAFTILLCYGCCEVMRMSSLSSSIPIPPLLKSILTFAISCGFSCRQPFDGEINPSVQLTNPVILFPFATLHFLQWKPVGYVHHLFSPFPYVICFLYAYAYH